MTGKLYIVGTPIGNLKDITLRALDTLKSVDVIACEDTRHTRILLDSYSVSKPLISYYRPKEREAAAKIVDELTSGKDVALVTDAGMPCLSDPGAILVNECIENGIAVESVPGPSAVITAFSVSGIIDTGFVFLGFLPDKAGDRKKVTAAIPSYKMPVAMYVAPHDIEKILKELKAVPGIGRITVVKELTKLHESVIRITDEIPQFDQRGEFVVIAEPKETADDESPAFEALEKLLADGATPSAAAKEIAALYGVNKNLLYKYSLNLNAKK
ncbi:MAG TPA: 16S rRNA (cytidine(1402)-2'-O)-methyltransferase [Candidatus Stercoripulliclostridium merdigallinarum]|uniref:Ribosomal RNA small subunit methyltransferase I n=1 Tax=Candidatus Stercoripulliclostridium merdigallinarum TaxID=2840951 RepID=A0A9D1SH77_9FIRM|nr:16S rRNA (cytidine(1402)-2'-O)-methyltransferase [Candidatus Stercoripulliclostridium merdigallinarum]